MGKGEENYHDSLGGRERSAHLQEEGQAGVKRPREKWTAIPVPDSGISPETIARARAMVENNTWNVSPNPARTWELSGGIGLCGQCGSRLKTYSTSNAYKTKYFYYICPKRLQGDGGEAQAGILAASSTRMPARTTSGPMPSPPMTPISTTALC